MMSLIRRSAERRPVEQFGLVGGGRGASLGLTSVDELSFQKATAVASALTSPSASSSGGYAGGPSQGLQAGGWDGASAATASVLGSRVTYASRSSAASAALAAGRYRPAAAASLRSVLLMAGNDSAGNPTEGGSRYDWEENTWRTRSFTFGASWNCSFGASMRDSAFRGGSEAGTASLHSVAFSTEVRTTRTNMATATNAVACAESPSVFHTFGGATPTNLIQSHNAANESANSANVLDRTQPGAAVSRAEDALICGATGASVLVSLFRQATGTAAAASLSLTAARQEHWALSSSPAWAGAPMAAYAPPSSGALGLLAGGNGQTADLVSPNAGYAGAARSFAGTARTGASGLPGPSFSLLAGGSTLTTGNVDQVSNRAQTWRGSSALATQRNHSAAFSSQAQGTLAGSDDGTTFTTVVATSVRQPWATGTWAASAALAAARGGAAVVQDGAQALLVGGYVAAAAVGTVVRTAMAQDSYAASAALLPRAAAQAGGVSYGLSGLIAGGDESTNNTGLLSACWSVSLALGTFRPHASLPSASDNVASASFARGRGVSYHGRISTPSTAVSLSAEETATVQAGAALAAARADAAAVSLGAPWLSQLGQVAGEFLVSSLGEVLVGTGGSNSSFAPTAAGSGYAWLPASESWRASACAQLPRALAAAGGNQDEARVVGGHSASGQASPTSTEERVLYSNEVSLQAAGLGTATNSGSMMGDASAAVLSALNGAGAAANGLTSSYRVAWPAGAWAAAAALPSSAASWASGAQFRRIGMLIGGQNTAGTSLATTQRVSYAEGAALTTAQLGLSLAAGRSAAHTQAPSDGLSAHVAGGLVGGSTVATTDRVYSTSLSSEAGSALGTAQRHASGFSTPVAGFLTGGLTAANAVQSNTRRLGWITGAWTSGAAAGASLAAPWTASQLPAEHARLTVRYGRLGPDQGVSWYTGASGAWFLRSLTLDAVPAPATSPLVSLAAAAGNRERAVVAGGLVTGPTSVSSSETLGWSAQSLQAYSSLSNAAHSRGAFSTMAVGFWTGGAVGGGADANTYHNLLSWASGAAYVGASLASARSGQSAMSALSAGYAVGGATASSPVLASDTQKWTHSTLAWTAGPSVLAAATQLGAAHAGLSSGLHAGGSDQYAGGNSLSTVRVMTLAGEAVTAGAALGGGRRRAAPGGNPYRALATGGISGASTALSSSEAYTYSRATWAAGASLSSAGGGATGVSSVPGWEVPGAAPLSGLPAAAVSVLMGGATSYSDPAAVARVRRVSHLTSTSAWVSNLPTPRRYGFGATDTFQAFYAGGAGPAGSHGSLRELVDLVDQSVAPAASLGGAAASSGYAAMNHGSHSTWGTGQFWWASGAELVRSPDMTLSGRARMNTVSGGSVCWHGNGNSGGSFFGQWERYSAPSNARAASATLTAYATQRTASRCIDTAAGGLVLWGANNVGLTTMNGTVLQLNREYEAFTDRTFAGGPSPQTSSPGTPTSGGGLLAGGHTGAATLSTTWRVNDAPSTMSAWAALDAAVCENGAASTHAPWAAARA